MCAGITNAQRKNVECVKEEASDRATQVTVDLIRRKPWVLNCCLFACVMRNGWLWCTQWWISLYLTTSNQCCQPALLLMPSFSAKEMGSGGQKLHIEIEIRCILIVLTEAQEYVIFSQFSINDLYLRII